MLCRRRSRATCSAPGDWTTARLDGVAYLEKAPLIYWLIAARYKIFGATDWAARIPIALSCVGLALLTTAHRRLGFRAQGRTLCRPVIGTCVGLFLFTRILIPDVMLTLTIALACGHSCARSMRRSRIRDRGRSLLPPAWELGCC